MCEGDALYACDGDWWVHNDGLPDLAIEKWTQDEKSAKEYCLHHVRGEHNAGFGFRDCIHLGGNSGFQAINLAILFGANQIALLGFDMHMNTGKRHFFGDHEGKMNKDSPYHQWIQNFEYAARHLNGVKITNSTVGSALTCFPFVALEGL